MRVARLPQFPAYAYLVLAVASVVAYALTSSSDVTATTLYGAIGTAAAVAIAVGGRRLRGAAALPWYLFALGIGLMTAGDTAYGVRDLIGWGNPVPSWSDYCYFAAYPALVAGLVLLVRAARAVDKRRRTLDAAIVALALIAVLWTPYFSNFSASAGHPLAERLTLALYPSFDLVLLALVVAYLLLRRWRMSEAFLPTAVLCLLAADLVWAVAPDSYTAGDWMDRMWLLSYSLWAVAALHPGARETTGVAPDRGALSRFAVFAAPLLLLPAGAAIDVARGLNLGTVDVAIWAAVMAGLLVRITLLVASIDRSEERFRLTFTHARAGMLRADPSGAILDANDALLAIVHGTREQVVGHSAFDFLLPSQHDAVRGEIQAVLAAGTFESEERPIRAVDGSVVWIRTKATLIPEGAEAAMLVEVEDVTERRRQEAELRASEERFRRLFEEAAIGLATLDAQMRITNVNEALIRIGGVPRERALGCSILDFIAEGGREAAASDLAAALRQGRYGPTEHRMRRADGGDVWVLTSASVLPSSEGPTILVDIQDITALKRYETELVEANRQKEELISVVSHDLRTPLTSIVGYLELLEEAEEDEALAADRAQFVRVAIRNAERLSRLVEDLLFVSRAHAGHAGLDLRPVEVTEVARHALAAVRPLADAKRIELELVGNGASVTADEHRLAEAIENLLSNAVKFSPEGSRVRVDVVEDEQDEVAVRVVDSGPGIAPEDVPHIFERFYRASATEGAPGNGLGLAIVEAIAAAHDGSISVETVPGEGATFVLRLPRRGPVGDLALHA